VGELEKLSRDCRGGTEVNHDIPQSGQLGTPFGRKVLPVAVRSEIVAYTHLLLKLGKDRVAA